MRTYDTVSDTRIAALPEDTLYVPSTNKVCNYISQLKVDDLQQRNQNLSIYGLNIGVQLKEN